MSVRNVASTARLGSRPNRQIEERRRGSIERAVPVPRISSLEPAPEAWSAASGRQDGADYATAGIPIPIPKFGGGGVGQMENIYEFALLDATREVTRGFFHRAQLDISVVFKGILCPSSKKFVPKQ